MQIEYDNGQRPLLYEIFHCVKNLLYDQCILNETDKSYIRKDQTSWQKMKRRQPKPPKK